MPTIEAILKDVWTEAYTLIVKFKIDVSHLFMKPVRRATTKQTVNTSNCFIYSHECNIKLIYLTVFLVKHKRNASGAELLINLITLTYLADALYIYEYIAKTLSSNCTNVHECLMLASQMHWHSSLKLLLLLSFVTDQQFHC